MKIIITRSTFIGGRLIEAAPYPVDVLDPIAKQLLALGKAVMAPEPSAPLPKGDESVSVETPAGKQPIEPSAPSEDSKAAEKKAKAEAKAAAKKAKAEAKAKAANPE